MSQALDPSRGDCIAASLSGGIAGFAAQTVDPAAANRLASRKDHMTTTPASPPPPSSPTPPLSGDAVRQALRGVKDPELDLNIVDLGLVYDVEVDQGNVAIKMTLTSPGCPAGPMITNDVYKNVRAMPGVRDVDVEIVWEPYWTPERIEPKIRAMMGF